MEPVTWIFGGITVAVVSGAIGRGFNKNNVNNSTCKERQGSCTALLSQKIDSLAEDIKEIKEAVKTVQ